MALSRPHIVVNSVQNLNDTITVFLQIESDKGPTGDIVFISSLEEFLINYQSSNKSSSYELAIFLLQLGYRLYVQRVNSSSGMQSVRLLSSDNTVQSLTGSYTYAFPRKDYEYTALNIVEGNVIGNTFSYTFVFDRAVNSNDYLMIHTGISWNLIYFNRSSAPLPANSYSKAYYSTGTLESIRNIMEKYLGMRTSIIDNTIVMYTYHRFMTPVTSFTDSYISEEVNNDVYCSLTESSKVLDVFSLVPSSTNDLSMIVNRTMDLYQVKFQLMDPETLIPIYEESYTVPVEEDGLYEAVININSTSKLVELEYYGGLLPSGSVRFLRGCTTSTVTSEDFINCINNGAIDDNYPDIVLESPITSQDYHNAVVKVVREKPTPTIILSQYNSDYLYSDRFLINFFDGIITLDNISYPSYTYLLALLSRSTDEGSYPNVRISVNDETYDLEVNIPTENNYGVSELSNPVGYLTKDSQVPSGLLIAYSIAINRLMSGLDLVQVSEQYLSNKLNDAVNSAKSLTGTDLSMSISNYSLENRFLRFTVNVELRYELSKQFELIISIKRSS